MTENVEDQQLMPEQPAPSKTVRKKTAKTQEVQPASTEVRKWEDLVPQIREMKEAGVTVPEIAEKLKLSYVLVNQVIQQSYKMSVDTIGVFERQEKMRLGIEA